MDVYETSDLSLASVLSCLGYNIMGIDRNNPRRAVFYFSRQKEGLEQSVKRYWDGSLLLPPAALFTHQRMLKQRLYDERT